MRGFRTLAMLPVVTVLWTNLHGGFFVGVLMICAYGGGELLQLLIFAGPAKRGSQRPAARHGYFLSAVACLAASLINPYTYHLHVHMVRYLRDPWNAQHINEFFSPNFHHSDGDFLRSDAGVGGRGSACWHCGKGRYTEPILMLVWAHGGLLAARNIPIFVIVAAPIGGRRDSAVRWTGAARLERGRLGARRRRAKFNRIAADTGETERDRRAGTW